MQITPDNINEMFDNPLNKQEGFGIFLVVREAGHNLIVPRLELAKIDAMDTFESDIDARKYFMRKLREGPENNRYVKVLNQLNAVDKMAAQQILFAETM